jgi:hypothetical protein
MCQHNIRELYKEDSAFNTILNDEQNILEYMKFISKELDKFLIRERNDEIVERLKLKKDMDDIHIIMRLNYKLVFYLLKCVEPKWLSTEKDNEKLEKLFYNHIEQIHDDCLQVFINKNKDYGNSFAKHGQIGILVRISDKISRIINIISNGKNFVNESLLDTIRDLINYTCMYLIS